ncbi:hypothetical protein [Pelagicoccus albus]|uniref:TVP38/TMEM64 family membrane protein n=1 Tax=Pelagicoccus albus TaxID=415222 RepID=A0A7X1E9N9_9BACT|nr:hypothetical protein [Pelagicoccus albus]MBC2608060.1 hypothetical protein [Pelagicoccus albus]
MPKPTKTRIAFSAAIFVALAIVAWRLVVTYDITWDEFKDAVQNAPAWIFLLTLVFLPPLGLPLSIFLFAVGARFGLGVAASVACLAIVAHHVIALGLSNTVSRFVSTSQQQEGLWQKLEEKAGGNSSKLLFLWGLLPGLPYVVKMYLPLAMGVKASPYLKWNSSGHALGAILFVGFGNAVFDGVGVGAIIIIGLGIILSVAIKLYKHRLKKSEQGQGLPSPDAT